MTSTLSEALALEQTNQKLRNIYKKNFNCLRLRSFLGRDLEESGPTELELISYLKHVRKRSKRRIFDNVYDLFYAKQYV